MVDPSTRASMSLCGILFHALLISRFNCRIVNFNLTFILDFTIPHKFSMGFKSGLLWGHFSTLMPFSSRNFFVFLAVCAGAPSCMNTLPLMFDLFLIVIFPYVRVLLASWKIAEWKARPRKYQKTLPFSSALHGMRPYLSSRYGPRRGLHLALGLGLGLPNYTLV